MYSLMIFFYCSSQNYGLIPFYLFLDVDEPIDSMVRFMKLDLLLYYLLCLFDRKSLCFFLLPIVEFV